MCNFPSARKYPARLRRSGRGRIQKVLLLFLLRGRNCNAVILATAVLAADMDCGVAFSRVRIARRWVVAKNSRVKFGPCYLAVELRFNLAAALAGNKALRGPLLDGLRRKPQQVAERSLRTAGESYRFRNSGFHNQHASVEGSLTT